MKRTKKALTIEKNNITKALQGIDGIDNKIPVIQTHTYNFKGRKSSDIASELISRLTPTDGIVCDPFAGANSFGIAAATAKRHFIGSELDNYTFSVNKALFTKCNFDKLNNFFSQIKAKCMRPIMELYATKCCGEKNYISKLHFDPEGINGFDEPEYYHPTPHRDISNNKTIILACACPICGSKRKKFEKIDMEKIISINKMDTSRFPKHHLIENSRINITSTHDADLYNRNFSKRAQVALLCLQDAIIDLPESPERDILEHCLVASLTLSRICQYGSGSEYIYQVMRKQAQEKNVWELFNNKVKSFIKFKKQYSALQFSDITDESNILSLKNCDYRVLLSNHKNFFDIIYTDPPYTDQVPYLERSQLYRDWLHVFYDKNNQFLLSNKMLNEEIIISNAPSRAESKSGAVQYYNDIDEMFKRFYSSLKQNGRVVLTVKLGSNKYLLTLAEYIKLARKNGFEYITKIGIDKKDPTLRKQSARKNTMMNEMIVFFIKLDKDDKYWYHGNIDIESELTKLIYNFLKNSSSGFMSLTECVTMSQSFLTKHFNILPNTDVRHKIQRVIENNFSVAKTSFVYIDSNKLYLSEEDDTDLFAKLYDIIPVIIKKFDTPNGFTLEDLYFELINSLFDGDGNILDKIIETDKHESQIRILLDNYCTMDDQNKYFLKKYHTSVSENAVDVSTMDGYEFEELIKKLLIKKGFYDVVRIGGAGDRGIDIMAKSKESGKEEGYIIQCKRWIGNVSGTPIQRLHSMMIQMSPIISHALCITTSGYTADAIRESKSTKVKIVNGHQLMDELNQYFPNQYYHGALDII